MLSTYKDKRIYTEADVGAGMLFGFILGALFIAIVLGVLSLLEPKQQEVTIDTIGGRSFISFVHEGEGYTVEFANDKWDELIIDQPESGSQE